MSRAYNNKMDRVRLSLESKEHMIAQITVTSQRAPRARRVLRTGLIAAIVAATITIAAGAVWLITPVLRNYYAGAGYDQSAGALGKLVTRNGWTMTLTDCVGDDNYLYLGLNLTAPAGTVLNAKETDGYKFEQYDFLFDDMKHQAMAWRMTQVPDGNTADNSVKFVIWIETGSEKASLNGRKLKLKMSGLYHFGAWNEKAKDYEYIYDCDKTWDFSSVSVAYPDNAIRLAPNVSVDVLGTVAKLASVDITPIGVTIQIQGDSLKGHHKEYNSGYCIALPEIKLYGKDGAEIIPDKGAAPFGVRGGSSCGGGSDKSEAGFLRIVQSYGHLLDLNNVGRIEVSGMSIEL